LPIALWSLLASSYELVTSGRSLPVDAFVDRVSRIVPPSIEDADAAGAGYRSWLTTQTMKALWETGFGTDASRFWALNNVYASVEPFRGHEHPKTGLCVRLPLGAGDAYAAAVWMDMTLRLARWKNTLLNAFWVPQQTMLLHFGPPPVATFPEPIAPPGTALPLAGVMGGQIGEPDPFRSRQIGRRLAGPRFRQHLEGDVTGLQAERVVRRAVDREHLAADLVDVVALPRVIHGHARQGAADRVEGGRCHAPTPTPIGQVTPVPPMPQ